MTEKSSQFVKRLILIDKYLSFRGQVSRADLVNHFDIGIATASRTLKEYRHRYPGNLTYSVSNRSYIVSNQFSQAFDHDVDKALTLIAYGLDIQEIKTPQFGQPSPLPFTAPLSSAIVSIVTRALVRGGSVKVEYASGSSGYTKRTIAPHSLFQGGGHGMCVPMTPIAKNFEPFDLTVSSKLPALQA